MHKICPFYQHTSTAHVAHVDHAQPETAKEAASQALSSLWMLAVAATGFVLSKAKKESK
ncbi:hypothetical protein G6R29_04490 [Fructobacillus sp. M2-14]|uniref:Uncharacterized protein n=1 Tax=Fructobacillus broussonetiae TaxID=2713173 RepID=A0ABS5R1I0_9LACO|nr:hypothetical protein [Fructobacillus broussonetiae]MBS9338882.1 hypothetical protein [Fructobacillus broussonetiae]